VSSKAPKRLSILSAGLGSVLLGSSMPARAIEDAASAPVPFFYTDTSKESSAGDDAYWSSYFAGDTEVALHLPSYVAHLKIGLPGDAVAVVGILYAPRLCAEVVDGDPGVAKCPIVLTIFRHGENPLRIGIQTPGCLVHFGAKPPPQDTAVFNGAFATAHRENGPPYLTLSAVLHGELISDCTVRAPLGPS
jgi:hypothetical protein